MPVNNLKVKSRKLKKETVGEVEVTKGTSIMRGRVVSSKTLKTVTVLIERVKTHPLYQKGYKRSKRYLVHDEIGVAEGDMVEICQIKPVSANKHFKILKVIGKDMEAIITEQLKAEAAAVIAEVMPSSAAVVESKSEEKELELSEKKTKETKKRKGGNS